MRDDWFDDEAVAIIERSATVYQLWIAGAVGFVIGSLVTWWMFYG